MGEIAKKRELLKLMRDIIHFLNEDEIFDISVILLKALKRIEVQANE